jgi:hypothetical protein
MKLYAICWRDPGDGHNWAPAVGDAADFQIQVGDARGLPEEVFFWDPGEADTALAEYLGCITKPWGEWSVQEYDVPDVFSRLGSLSGGLPKFAATSSEFACALDQGLDRLNRLINKLGD